MGNTDIAEPASNARDESLMRRAIAVAAEVRTATSPNPWVGAVVSDTEGRVVGIGATQPPGGSHAEVDALAQAGDRSAGGTIHVTLEPCAHKGRTGPCVDAIVEAGIDRVVFAIDDPDSASGAGAAGLSNQGVEVVSGVLAAEVEEQLAAYLHHRRTGRPFVIVKLAATLDGRLALADGASNWITGEAARADAHRLRAESDAILVGARTVRTDDPSLTVRDYRPSVDGSSSGDPRRFVLGHQPLDGAQVAPAELVSGDLNPILDRMGADGVLQLLVEGGGDVVGQFVRAGLVDRFILYYAPVLAGGSDAVPMLRGPAVPTMSDLTRGRFASVDRLGDDIRVVVVPGGR